MSIKISGRRFVDEDNREVILSGLNFVCKDKACGYVFDCDESLFEGFKRQGHNLIRMGLIWDGVEPEPFSYDDAYLEKIKRQIKWAEKNGIYVFLDMHQDLYSAEFEDGAPGWATFTGGNEYEATTPWAMAYYSNAAVNHAFDSFWSNAPATDGVGIREHYVKMWAHVARFFADCDNIIGYDIINEPYPGSRASEAFAKAIAELLSHSEENGGDENARLLSMLSDTSEFIKALAPVQEAVSVLEHELLTPLYEQAARAVREINSTALVLFEPSYYSNIGVRSGLVPSEMFSEYHSAAVYSPHAYDLVVDTDNYDSYSIDRLRLFFDAHREYQDKYDLPVIMGEWGGFPEAETAVLKLLANLSLIEENLWSNTYWCWHPHFPGSPCERALIRAYPQRTAGRLLSYKNENGKFRLELIPNNGETVLFVPDAARLKAENVIISGEAGENVQLDVSRATENIILIRAEKSDMPIRIEIEG